MTEPATSTSTVLLTTGSSVAGLTLFGIATGLHIHILVIGLLGGLWALYYQPPASLAGRVCFLVVSSVVAGYFAPAAASILAAVAASQWAWWPRELTREALQYPVAFGTGFLALRWLGPALLRRAEKLEDR